MSQLSPKTSGTFSSNSDSPQPDFENNLTEFEASFQRFVTETDPNFDFNLLRYNLNPFAADIIPSLTDVYYPTSKQELNKTVTVDGLERIDGMVFGERVVIKENTRIKGNIYGIKGVLIGADCVIEGNVISGGNVQVDNGSRIEGLLLGEEVIINGKVNVIGPAISRGEFTVNGTLEAQELVAVHNITLSGSESDYVKLEAHTMFAQSGEIDAKIPVKLGQTAREADINSQRFYLTRGTDGTFRLARAPSPYQEGVRPAQGTLITNLSDAELEKLLAEMASLER